MKANINFKSTNLYFSLNNFIYDNTHIQSQIQLQHLILFNIILYCLNYKYILKYKIYELNKIISTKLLGKDMLFL